MADLLIGCPGENEETVRTTIETAKKLEIPLVGIAAGIRIYKGTQLKKQLDENSNTDSIDITQDGISYYISPLLGTDPFGLIRELTGSDERFLTLSAPGDTDSYNYADDDALMKADEVGRCVDMHGIAGGFEHGLEVGGDGALAIGAGDMHDGRQPEMRVAELGKQALDAAQGQVDQLRMKQLKIGEELVARGHVRLVVLAAYRADRKQAANPCGLTAPAARAL